MLKKKKKKKKKKHKYLHFVNNIKYFFIRYLNNNQISGSLTKEIKQFNNLKAL